MASGKSNALKNAVLDHVLGGPDYVRKATLWLALYTVAPTSAGGGTEVSGGSYARVAITNNATNFPASASGVKSNGVAFAFPQATADWAVGANFIVAAALHDNVSTDSVVHFGTLTTNRQVPNGVVTNFPIGTISFSET